MKIFLPVILLLLFVISCNNNRDPNPGNITKQNLETVIIDSLGKVFEEAGYDGCFEMLIPHQNKKIFYNKRKCFERTSPASTFKIFNSMAALETGIAQDTGMVIKWDGRKRWYKRWDQDHSLAMAYKNSTVWYYQELARRIGRKKMQYLLDTCNYGNRKIGNKIDLFWLDGSLKISPDEQIDFLRRLSLDSLPISQNAMKQTRSIMVFDEGPDYLLRAKTGASTKHNAGWFVGWVEKEAGKYYFATRIRADSLSAQFMQARIGVSIKILKMLEILP